MFLSIVTFKTTEESAMLLSSLGKHVADGSLSPTGVEGLVGDGGVFRTRCEGRGGLQAVLPYHVDVTLGHKRRQLYLRGRSSGNHFVRRNKTSSVNQTGRHGTT